MSANRKPSKATDAEIKEFHEKTKDIISKTGLYYDPITKKTKKALKQNGKEKGSARTLIKDTKYLNYLKQVVKRMGEDNAADIRTRAEVASSKGFSNLQKERKLFGKMGGLGAILTASVVATKDGLDKAKKAAGDTPTNVKPKSPGLLMLDEDEGDKLKVLSDKGSPVVQPAQTKLKKRKAGSGKKPATYKKGSDLWYQQQQMMARARAEKAGTGGEEGMKAWRRKQQIEHGLNPTAGKKDILNAIKNEEKKKQDQAEAESARSIKEAYEALMAEEEAEKRGVQAGNLRKKRVDEGATEQQKQEDKIDDVILDNNAPAENPLDENANVEQTVDVAPDGGFSGEEQSQELPSKDGNVRGSGETKEENIQPEDVINSRHDMPGRRKGQEFNPEEPKPFTASENQEDAQRGSPPIPEEARPNNVRMEITDKGVPDIEVEVNKDAGLGFGEAQRSFVSPAAERVSMERNRMKYSPLRLFEEIKAFVRIYSDDIKTGSWKKLKEDFKKLSSKTPAIKLRQIHREMEEEVIEYYQGRQGVRLGVIIDPSVLGININQLQNMMNPSMPMNTGNSVREIGTQQARVKAKEVHYNLGGYKHATGAMMEEGKNINNSSTSNQHKHTRIRVPENHRQRFLFKPSTKSRKPINLKIRS